jgi:hypothetical protein
LARFERSTLPEHEGTRTLVLRFLKIITPVKSVPLYDGYIVQPTEGQLHQRSARNFKNIYPQVWGVNIDKKKGDSRRSLQLLWDSIST